MLQDCPYLDFETIGEIALRADIVEGHISETVDFVKLALVDGVRPVDVEKTVDGRRNLVHIIDVESDDPDAYDVRDVCKGFVLVALQFQFAGERIFCLDPVFQCRYENARIIDSPLKLVKSFGGLFFELRQIVAVFLKNRLAMGIQMSLHKLFLFSICHCICRRRVPHRCFAQ